MKTDIDSIKEDITKWVNEVKNFPTSLGLKNIFSVIDDDFVKVNDTIETLAERVRLDFKEFEENIESKTF